MVTSILPVLKQSGAEGKACRDCFISSFLSSVWRVHHLQPSQQTPLTLLRLVCVLFSTNHPKFRTIPPHHTITRIPTVKGWSGDPEVVRKHLVDASRPNSILVGQSSESMRAQALQRVLGLLRLLWLVRWRLRHLHHVFKSKCIKQCKPGSTVGVRGLAGFFVPFFDSGVTLDLWATASSKANLVIQSSTSPFCAP